MVRVTLPEVTVMVASRADVDGFASALTVIVPFIEPETGETVNHDALLLTVQLALEVMVKVRRSPNPSILCDVTETVIVASRPA
jgi:hypothetical protein